MSPLGDRSTTDLLVLLIAGTIATAVLLVVVGVTILEIVDSSIDTAGAAALIGQILNTLVGLLAGFLAGRTERSSRDR